MLLDRGLLGIKTACVPFCANCGRDLSPAAVACPNCGQPGPGARIAVEAPPAKRTEGFAIASLACAIGGFFIVPIVGSILAIVFGNTARKRIAQDPDLQGAEMARAGTIIGWVGLVLIVLFIAFLIAVVAAFRNWTF
jgi:MFS family permease